MKTQKEVEEMFDKKCVNGDFEMEDPDGVEDLSCYFDEDKIKSFIHQIRQEDREAMVEMLKAPLLSRLDFAQYIGKHNQHDADEREKFAKEETDKILSELNKPII